MVKFQPNYSKCEYFISLFWEKEVWIKQKTFLDTSTDALFFFAAQANEATREHGSCVVNKAALVPPTGTALIPSQYDIISVCNIGREEAPPSQDGGFSCSARTSVSCSPCCCYFFMINIDNSVQFGKDPGRKFASFVFPFDTQRGEAALSLWPLTVFTWPQREGNAHTSLR